MGRTRFFSGAAAVLILTAAVLGFGITSAYAALDDTYEITSEAYPQPAGYPVASSTADPLWRGGWGNSMRPDFDIGFPSIDTARYVRGGFLYVANRTAAPVIDPNNQYAVNRTVRSDGTHFTAEVNQWAAWQSVRLSNPTAPLEGVWYLHTKAFEVDQSVFPFAVTYATREVVRPYFVDITAPRQVTGVAVAEVPPQSGTSVGRLRISWTNVDYDTQSSVVNAGTAYFKVWVDGVARIPDITDPLDSSQGVPWYVPGGGTITIEDDLGPGFHTVQVSAVDRAGNEGLKSSVVYLNTGDSKPTVSVSAPLYSGAKVSAPVPVTLKISAPLGIDTATFKLDGQPISGLVSPLRGSLIDTQMTVLPSSVATPGAHILQVQVTDLTSQTVNYSLAFQVDEDVALRWSDFLTPPELWTATTANWQILTSTNGDIAGVRSWRQGWGKSFNPDFKFTTPAYAAANGIFMLYDVDRAPLTKINLADANSYSRSVRGEGTEYVGTVDLLGLLSGRPSLASVNYYSPKARNAAEGVWWWHVGFGDIDGGALDGTYQIPFGIDATRPDRVSGVRAYLTPTSTVPMFGWTPTGRTTVRWDDRQYDRMSGTAYYRVYVDGVCEIPGNQDLGDPVSPERGIPWYEPGIPGTNQVTIENLASGTHSIQVSAVDRATNEGTLSKPYKVYVDADAPVVAIKTPLVSGGAVGYMRSLSASASDQIGIKSLTFQVDGVQVGKVVPKTLAKSLSWSVKPNWARWAQGDHVVTVIAVDYSGHVTTENKDFYLDKSIPRVTITSRGYNPFYPFVRQGNRDDYIVKYKASSECTASLLVYDSKGRVVRTITQRYVAPSTVPEWSGIKKFVWDGKLKDGSMLEGTYTIKIKVFESGGNNSVKTVGKTKIVRWRLNRIAPDTVVVEEL